MHYEFEEGEKERERKKERKIKRVTVSRKHL